MDAGSGHGSAAKGLAIDLEVAGSGPVSCCFSIPSSFPTMCIYQAYLSQCIILVAVSSEFKRI